MKHLVNSRSWKKVRKEKKTGIIYHPVVIVIVVVFLLWSAETYAVFVAWISEMPQFSCEKCCKTLLCKTVQILSSGAPCSVSLTMQSKLRALRATIHCELCACVLWPSVESGSVSVPKSFLRVYLGVRNFFMHIPFRHHWSYWTCAKLDYMVFAMLCW